MKEQVPAVIPPKSVILEGDPEAQFAYAQRAAEVLMRRIEGKKRKIIISGKHYLEYGDWQTLSRFFGATAATEWTRRAEIDGKIVGYESRAVVYQHGIIISAAEAICLRSERNWQKREWHALMSMAQTRACAKALRNAFGWVAELGGYASTPAEEMEDQEDDIALEPSKGQTISSGKIDYPAPDQAVENIRRERTAETAQLTQQPASAPVEQDTDATDYIQDDTEEIWDRLDKAAAESWSALKFSFEALTKEQQGRWRDQVETVFKPKARKVEQERMQ